MATKEPTITIQHCLPGRLRCILSERPVDWPTMRKAVLDHEGIEEISWSNHTGSILINYCHKTVSREEIIIRIAVVLSVQTGFPRLRVLARPEQQEFSLLSSLSAILLALAGASVIIPGLKRLKDTMILISSLATAGAAIEHGYHEVRETGNFDPEVLSVVYLLTSLFSGKGLSAAVVTWIASFGRHLLSSPDAGIMLDIHQLQKKKRGKPSFDVSVLQGPGPDGLSSLLRLLPTVVADGLSGSRLGEDRLINRIREISREHTGILEGLHKIGGNIAINIK